MGGGSSVEATVFPLEGGGWLASWFPFDITDRGTFL